MKPSKRLQRTLMASAVMALAFGAAPSVLAAVSNTAFGTCTGAVGTDCVAGTGHASVSITSTLSVNEMRAISFGNFAVSTPTTTDTVVLGTDGIRTATGGFTPLNGASGGGYTGGGTSPDTGAESPGHYTISGGAEGGATQVYISFADTSGNVIDMCSKPDTNAAICDSYHHGNSVSIGAGVLTMDSFTINETGSDVYGHYIDNAGGTNTTAPGISNPFLPATTATSTSHNNSTGTSPGQIDVVVGATLHGTGTILAVGKYTGTFDIMASY